MDNKVYIIILNYNNWYDTIECLESVLRNDYPNYQVIVVDNNSQNNSVDYMKAWADGMLDICVDPKNPLRNLSFPPLPKPIPYVFYTKEEAEKGGNKDLEQKLMNNIPQGITTKYPIIFIENTKNLGFAGGNNIGIRYALAKNDFDSIILLNNDTVINRNTISNLVSAKLKLGEKAIYGGRIFYYSDPEKIWYDGGKLKEWKCRTSHLNMRKYKHEIKDITETKEVDYITFCCVLIPKIIIENIGLIDESYFMFFEDVDYSYIVRKSGYKLYHISNVNLWHKVSASVGEELHKSLNYLETISRVKFIIKRLPPLKKVTSFISVLSSKKNIMILLKYPLKRWN
jgi:GT2 family glycosyltransferase